MIFASVNNLVKNYGNHCAVYNLSFNVSEGEIFGLIGPNGAGKSTTINIITTLDEATSGSVTIDGMNTV
ncbi:ATP-binding cassette domain-containing protein [[Eubacterium] siraeum]|nr:ATP-binding cassette domain-containing protein [[Eubacterium] siraeum]